MNLCPEWEYRESLSDEDFWKYIYPEYTADFYDSDLDSETELYTPCPICHTTGACGYDSEGRPLIHTFEEGY